MKKWWICTLLCALSCTVGFAQEDRRLEERLDSALKLTELSDLDKLLDFTYPRLFTLVTREDMLSTLKSGLDNEDFSATVDSVRKVRVFPIFRVGEGQYAKISHSMRMNMRFKQELDSSEVDELKAAMREGFGDGNVTFDFATNTVSVSMLVYMVAIKDRHSPEWSFLTFADDEDDHELGTMLFPDGVLEKLKTYQ